MSFHQKILTKLFALIYRHWLWNSFYQEYDTVIKVKGWRTAITDDAGGQRRTIVPCFWGFD